MAGEGKQLGFGHGLCVPWIDPRRPVTNADLHLKAMLFETIKTFAA
jgi:hypothetical protein